MNPTAIPLAEYVALIERGEPFAQANYGDGEWSCILGHTGANVNGEPYDGRLRDMLRHTLEFPGSYWYGTNPGARREPAARAWVADHAIRATWVEKDTLSEANVRGEFGPFMRALRGRDVVVVGPPHIATMHPGTFPIRDHVMIPNNGMAWDAVTVLAPLVYDRIRPGDVVLFAAGMATNLIIHEIHPFVWDAVTLLDIGATLDPYCGVRSRKAYRRDAWWEGPYLRNLKEATP